MTIPLYARITSRLLARQEGMSVPPPTPGERAAAMSAIERAIAARGRAHRRNRWLGGLAAAAAVALVAGGAVHEVRHRSQTASSLATPSHVPGAADTQVVGYTVTGAASVVSSAGSAPLSERGTLPAGSRIVTPAGAHVMLAFATGTDVALGEGADMTIADEGSTQALRLDHGSLDLHVAKLSANQRFLVQTPDAEVEVRGTAFRVSLVSPDATCGAGTPTRVAVSEGVVVVRHAGGESRVEAGQQWPSGCAQAVAARASSRLPSAHGPTSAAPASSLGEQNDMFADAMAAKRRGDAGEALAAFDRLLARYPSSPLAESATVERMRLLRSADPERAPAAARQYIGRYPNGFARAEAETILAGTSSP